jgi:hypothetical protein
MITDKHSQTLIFWCQKSLSPTSNSKIHHLNSSFEQSDLSSLNSLNKNEHYKSASQNIQSGHNPTTKHSENFANAKVPSKINNFEGLEKVCHKFPQTFLLEETRHASPNLDRERSAKYRYSSNMAEHDSPQHIVTHHTWPSHKRSNPHPQPPLFSKHFSNIYLFPDLTILVLTILFRRRFQF